MKRRRKEKRRNRKNKEVHQKQSSKKKKRGDFSNVEEVKKRRYKNFTQGRSETQFKIPKTFSKIQSFDSFKEIKKRNRKTMRLFKTNGFLKFKKFEKLEMQKAANNVQKRKNCTQKEGQREQ